jgi:hypothetical protein
VKYTAGQFKSSILGPLTVAAAVAVAADLAAVYRVERHSELYLCGYCTNRLWAALFARGWAIWPAGEHALAPRADECSGALWQRTRRGRGSGRSPRTLRRRFRRLSALMSACWRARSRRLALSG